MANLILSLVLLTLLQTTGSQNLHQNTRDLRETRELFGQLEEAGLRSRFRERGKLLLYLVLASDCHRSSSPQTLL